MEPITWTIRWLLLPIVVAALCSAKPQVKAQSSPVPITPPPQYDPLLHPYTGKLTIRRVDRADTANRCSRQLRQYSSDIAVGCTQLNPYENSCEIWILNDYEINRMGFDYEAVLRHELGHCNGWRH